MREIIKVKSFYEKSNDTLDTKVNEFLSKIDPMKLVEVTYFVIAGEKTATNRMFFCFIKYQEELS